MGHICFYLFIYFYFALRHRPLSLPQSPPHQCCAGAGSGGNRALSCIWPPLTKAHKEKHLQWTQKDMKTYFQTVYFTDECYATLDCIRKARRIINDSSHPSHRLFSLLPSGRRLRSIRSRTSQLRDSFFPQAIRLMNSQN